MTRGQLVLQAAVVALSGTLVQAAINLTGDTNDATSTFARGQTVQTTFSASGLAANQVTQLNLTYVDQFGNTLQTQTVPVTANSSGNWTSSAITAPSANLGYYRVNATLSAGNTLLTALGSRKAGYLTYAVVPDPATRVDYGQNNSHFGLQGSFNSAWSTAVKSKLGVRWDLEGYFNWNSREPDYAGQWNGTFTPPPATTWRTTSVPCPGIMPTWAVIPGTFAYKTGALTPAGETAWATYCTKMATAYAQKYPSLTQDIYQITWEPFKTWGYNGTNAQLIKIYQIAYSAIHAADPKAVIMGPTLGVYSGYAAGPTYPSGYANETESVQLLKDGLGPYLDAFTTHAYYAEDYPGTVQGATDEAKSLVTRIRALKSSILQYTGKALPMYNTEHGVDDDGTGSLTGASGELNAARSQMRQAIIVLGEGYKVDYSFYLHDFWKTDMGGAGELSYKGFYYNLDNALPYGPAKMSPKPMIPAYAAMTYLLEGYDTTLPLETLGGNKWGYRFNRNLDSRTVQAFFDFSGTAESQTLWTGLDKVLVYDMMGNSQWQTTTNGNLTFNISQDVVYLVTPPAWSVNAAGTWNTASNWTTMVPNAPDAEAHFTSKIAAARVVTLDQAATVGTIQFNNSNSYTVAGTSTLTLQTTSGNAAINVDGGSHTISTPLTLASDVDVTIGGTQLTLSGTVAGGHGVNLQTSSTGTLVMSGSNTYTGVTRVNAGTLSANTLANGGAASAIGQSGNAAGNLVLDGGILRYTGAAASSDRLFSVGNSGGTLDASGTGAVNFSNTGTMGFNGETGVRTLTLTGTNTGANTLAAVIGDNSGATNVTKTGIGTWVLNAASRYTGVTTVNGGIYSVSVLANAGGYSGIGAAPKAASNLIINGGTLQYTGPAVSTNRNFSVGTSGGTIDASGTGAILFATIDPIGFNGQTGARLLTLAGTNTGNNTITQPIGDNGGATSLTKTGNGTWVLGGANTYAGGTTVSGGTLTVGHPSALGTGGLTVNTGATTVLKSGLAGAVTLPSLAITGTGKLDMTNNTMFVKYISGVSSIGSLTTLVKNGRNGGAWDGTGINSSTAAVNTSYGLGIADDAVGQQTKMIYTLLGDTNLDGHVDVGDLGTLLNNYGQAGKSWSDGECAYNATGTVDVGDLGLLLNNYGQAAAGAVVQANGMQLDSQAINLLAAHGITVVPEPTMLGLFGLGVGALLRRRRH